MVCSPPAHSMARVHEGIPREGMLIRARLRCLVHSNSLAFFWFFFVAYSHAWYTPILPYMQAITEYGPVSRFWFDGKGAGTGAGDRYPVGFDMPAHFQKVLDLIRADSPATLVTGYREYGGDLASSFQSLYLFDAGPAPNSTDMTEVGRPSETGALFCRTPPRTHTSACVINPFASITVHPPCSWCLGFPTRQSPSCRGHCRRLSAVSPHRCRRPHLLRASPGKEDRADSLYSVHANAADAVIPPPSSPREPKRGPVFGV